MQKQYSMHALVYITFLVVMCGVHTALQAQSLNRHSFTLQSGSVILPEWNARFGVENSLSYSYLIWTNLFITGGFGRYYGNASAVILTGLPAKGEIFRMRYSQWGLGLGYQAKFLSKSYLNIGLGVNHRYLVKSFIEGSGVHSGGWIELLGESENFAGFGGNIFMDYKYAFSKHFSGGIYLVQKFYNEGGNATSYGFQFLYNFGVPPDYPPRQTLPSDSGFMPKNYLRIGVSEINSSDWVGRYCIQPSISYSYYLFGNIFLNTRLSYYNATMDSMVLKGIPKENETVSIRMIEDDINAGYRFTIGKGSFLEAGGGLSFLYFDKDFVAVADINSPISFDVQLDSKNGNVIGGNVFLGYNFYLSRNMVMGAEIVRKFYGNSQKTTSYGVKIGCVF